MVTTTTTVPTIIDNTQPTRSFPGGKGTLEGASARVDRDLASCSHAQQRERARERTRVRKVSESNSVSSRRCWSVSNPDGEAVPVTGTPKIANR